MSLADAGAPRPPGATPVYTVYPGGQQGNANYGFRLAHPQEPPPKYEDVVSGEYLKWNLVNCARAPAPIAPLVAPPPESEPPPQENQKEKSRTAAGALLVALLLTVIFIWRVSVN